jgi:hypothetical protein
VEGRFATAVAAVSFAEAEWFLGILDFAAQRQTHPYRAGNSDPNAQDGSSGKDDHQPVHLELKPSLGLFSDLIAQPLSLQRKPVCEREGRKSPMA